MMNPKEAKSLQKHYSLVLCPVLLEELISDLADPSIPSEDQVKSVVRLVSKANGLDTFTLPDARALIQAELLGGEKVSTEPGIPRFGGRNVVGPDGSRGVIFEESFEAKLLRNWSNGMFSQKDHEVAGQLKRDFIKY